MRGRNARVPRSGDLGYESAALRARGVHKSASALCDFLPRYRPGLPDLFDDLGFNVPVLPLKPREQAGKAVVLQLVMERPIDVA
jgi:hypothetical protein